MNQDRGTQQNGTVGDIKWEYFVNRDKSASRLFDELCRGLARVIRQLEPRTNHNDLSPDQLCNFYRSCGGDYDELFKNTGEHGLSWIYRTIGCYHSLQPTRSPFEPPAVPCLTEDGFVRWQTIQLLLSPQEHTAMIQKAVEVYEVPRRAGGQFPRSIPSTCFPPKPDVEMERWHRFVTSQINQESYMRRIKNSPYTSPQPEGHNSPGGYFVHSQHAKRPAQVRRRESLSEEEVARREAVRRRSSVPDVMSPGGTIYTNRDPQTASRSRSANRPDSKGQYHHRQRASVGTPNTYYTPPTSSHRPSENLSSRPHGSNTSIDRSSRPRDPRHDRHTSSGSRHDSTDEISSEDSYHSRKHRSGDDDAKRKSRWGASLMPSFFLSKNQRRHSSDGRVPTLNDGRRSPRNGETIRKYRTEERDNRSGRYIDSKPDRSSSGARISDMLPQNPPSARMEEPAYAHPPSSYRYPEPPPAPYSATINQNPNIPNGGSIPPTPTGAFPENNGYFEANPPSGLRKQGTPQRMATVSGVNGRRYAPSDARTTIEPMSRRNRASSYRTPVTSSVV